jgi:hypothetical protein
MKVPGTELTYNQLNCVRALITGASYKEAALEAEVTINSIHRWLRDPEFAEMVKTGRDAAFQNASMRLSAGAFNAVCILEELSNDETVSPATRARCASDLLTHAIKVKEIVELADRITQIELVSNVN